MANKARRLLINIGKILPFIVCLVLAIHYAEVLVSVLTDNYVMYGDCLIVNTPLSFLLARVVQYDLTMVFVMFVTGVAIEACKWNIMSTVYLAFNLLEKNCIVFEVTITAIVILSFMNLLISVFFVYKGYSVFLKTVK